MGRGIVESGLFRSERVQFELRTTDPANSKEGEAWVRTDLAPNTDQLATLRFDGGASTFDVPIFDSAATVTNVEKVWRVSIGGTVGFIPLAAAGKSGAYPQVKYQHGGNALDGHDSLEVSVIPDSVETQYRFEDDSDTTTALDGVGSNNATISGPTYTSNAAIGSHAIEDDGVDSSGNNVKSNTTVDLVTSGDSQALSVGCFARPEGAIGFHYPVSHGIDGGNNLAVVAGGNAGNWLARLAIGGTVVFADSGVSVLSSTYTSVFALADQSEVGIIVDGTLEATTTHSFDLTNIGAGTHKAIQGHNSQSNIFDGGVDDATYASDRLTAAEVQQLIGI